MDKTKLLTLTFEFGEVSVYPNHIVCVMKEGITVKPEYNNDLIEVSHTYFENRPFGYITYRKNSYAVDPRIYAETSKIENLAAFAVITPDIEKISTTEFEKNFLSKPFRRFSALDKAVDWVETLVKDAL